jgi:hypothetical protein
MKTLLFNLKIAAVLISLNILLSAGCDGDKINVGYYYVDVPGYEVADYKQMLSSKNPEEQYNALAYLSFNLEDTKVLKYDSMKGTGRYDTALLIYNKALALTSSPNSWVSSAAFHLLGQFEYEEAQDAYRKQMLQNQNPSLNVQMELFIQLQEDSIADYNLLKEKIKFLKQQPSWLLKKSAFVLMKRGDSLMMNDVMNEYTAATNPVDKLLLLDALTMNMNDAVFQFLTKVWDTAKDDRVKTKITHHIPYARHPQTAFNWYAQHIDVLKKQMNDFVENGFANATAQPLLSKLIVLGLEKGWDPKDLLMVIDDNRFNNTPKLYFFLLQNKYKTDVHPDSIVLKQSMNSKRVEAALLQHPAYSKEWLAYETKHQPRALPPQLITAHRQLTEVYINQTRMLMQQYGIDTMYYSYLLESLNNNAGTFYKKRLNE